MSADFCGRCMRVICICPTAPVPADGGRLDSQHPGTEVTARDLLTDEDGVVVIRDNYVLITDGTCEQVSVQAVRQWHARHHG